MKPTLVPLQCAACGGRVPLVAGDATPCPSCGATVEIPSEYRELRDSERQLDDVRREAHRIAVALAHVPPWPVRMLAMFDHWAFIGFGLAFWITAGVTIGVLLPPLFGARFGVSTVDVLDENTQAWIGFIVPIGTFALGLLGAGWARKRVIVRGGLQAALAARPPERAGGPAGCRQCGAALVVGRGASAVTCPYCDTENIVNLPSGFLDKVRQQKLSLGREVERAIKEWNEQRSALRWSLFWRAVLGVVLVGLPSTCLLGAAPQTGNGSIEYAAGKPGLLPSWGDSRPKHVPRVGFCKPGVVRITGFTTRTEDCNAKGCLFHRIVPLEQGETLRVVGADLPEVVRVALQIHERTFFEDRWTDVGSGVVTDEVPLVLRPTLSAWYRLAFEVPGIAAGTTVRACVERM